MIMRRCFTYFFAVVLVLQGLTLAAQENDGRIIDAVQKYSDHDFNGAVRILDAIIDGNPSEDAAWYYRGMCKLFLRDSKGACEDLGRAAALDSTNYWYRYNLAGAFSMAGQTDLTIAQYEQLQKDFPKKTDIPYNLVNLYLHEQRYDDALRTIREIEALQGKNDATVMTSYRILLQQKKQEEALDVLKEYNDEYSSPQVLTMLGDHEMGMFNDSTALKYYDEALMLDSGYAPARLGKAEAYRMTRQYPEYFHEIGIIMADTGIKGDAKADYLSQLIRNTDPRFVTSWRGNMDEVFTSMLEHHPKDSSVTIASVQYFIYTDRKERALELTKQNMEDYPDSPQAAADCIVLYNMLEDYEGMVETAEKAEERFPGMFVDYIAAGEYNRKNYERVKELYEQVLRNEKNDKERRLNAYSMLGDLHHLTGDSKKAYSAYENALKINPDYLPVLNNYAYYLSLECERKGGIKNLLNPKMRKAFKMSQKAVEAEPDNPTYLDTLGWIYHLIGNDEAAKTIFKHAMLYGGKESATILSHYATVLDGLKETDLAKVYRNMANEKPKEE